MLRGALAAALGLVLALATSAPAAADTICVGTGTGCEPTLASALAEAAATPGANTIDMSAGTYSEGSLSYTASNPLTIEGAGPDATTITTPLRSASPTVLSLGSPAAIYLSQLQIHLPGAESAVGMRIGGGGSTSLDHVKISGEAGTSSATGLDYRSDAGPGSVTHVSVNLPNNDTCIDTASPSLTLSDDSLSCGGTGGGAAVMVAAGATVAQRLTISGGSYGMWVLGGEGTLQDSLLTGVRSGALYVSVGLGNSANLVADQDTVVGAGYGRGVECDNLTGGSSQIDLTDSIITNFATSLYRSDGPNTPCSITADYNDYEATVYNPDSGGGTLTSTHAFNVDPKFVNSAVGDYRLTAASPLLKLDDRALASGESSTDLAGSSRIACGARDLGSYEQVPCVVTGSAADLHPTGASIAGTANDGGLVGSWKVIYGTTPGYDEQTADTALSASSSDQPLATQLTGLTPQTTYYYAVVMTIAGRPYTGAQRNFTTPLPAAPVVLSGPGVAGSQTTAVLHGTVNPQDAPLTDCHFEYGSTSAYGTKIPCAQTVAGGVTATPVTAAISGLSAGRKYHFRLVAANAGGTSDGLDSSFATPDTTAPQVSIDSPASGTRETTSTVTVRGRATDNVAVTSLTVNGRRVPVSVTGAWSSQISLIPGTNTITAVAADAAGHHATARIAVVYWTARLTVSGRIGFDGGHISLPITCARGGAGCPVAVVVRYSERSTSWVLGSTRASLAAGETRKLRVPMNRKCRQLLAREHTLAVRVAITIRQPSGGMTVMIRTVVLKSTG